ncbi:hypothetical protein Nepgr_023943 [Nepenthes gracilis]|uniref:Uncharacterized protein n=1 Tax=Nepenthes gracilis TaxID=150966 RepID=A0AAD3T2A3_NEPGR|nr:hypothetical protein Nepgr_023943 [Nepenthes gracilis]
MRQHGQNSKICRWAKNTLKQPNYASTSTPRGKLENQKPGATGNILAVMRISSEEARDLRQQHINFTTIASAEQWTSKPFCSIISNLSIKKTAVIFKGQQLTVTSLITRTSSNRTHSPHSQHPYGIFEIRMADTVYSMPLAMQSADSGPEFTITAAAPKFSKQHTGLGIRPGNSWKQKKPLPRARNHKQQEETLTEAAPGLHIISSIPTAAVSSSAFRTRTSISGHSTSAPTNNNRAEHKGQLNHGFQRQHHQHQCNGPVATNSKGTKYISIVMASSGKRLVAVSCPSFSQKSRNQLKLLHRTRISSLQDASIIIVCKPRAPQQTQPNHKVSSNGETTV